MIPPPKTRSVFVFEPDRSPPSSNPGSMTEPLPLTNVTSVVALATPTPSATYGWIFGDGGVTLNRMPKSTWFTLMPVLPTAAPGTLPLVFRKFAIIVALAASALVPTVPMWRPSPQRPLESSHDERTRRQFRPLVRHANRRRCVHRGVVRSDVRSDVHGDQRRG